MVEKVKEVTFVTQKLKETFEVLQEGTFEDKELYKFINRAREDLLKEPLCGTRVPNRLIPKEYIKDYKINALWKYDLPNAWRLLCQEVSSKTPYFSMELTS